MTRLKLGAPREDGAWWMAGLCWACGWAAARQGSWEPVAVAIAAASLMIVAQALRTARRRADPDPAASRRSLLLAAAGLIPAAALLAWLVDQVRPAAAWIVPTALAAAYAGIIFLGKERRVISRILAVVVLSTLGPATYAAAARRIDATALLLWAALGGYFLLGSLFVVARLRQSRALLAAVRIGALGAFAGAILCSSPQTAHWVLSAAYLLLALRAWAFRPGGPPQPAPRVGKTELAYGFVAGALMILGIWLR